MDLQISGLEFLTNFIGFSGSIFQVRNKALENDLKVFNYSKNLFEKVFYLQFFKWILSIVVQILREVKIFIASQHNTHI